MTKTEYMKLLSKKLRRLPKEDYNRAVEYFEEYFAEAGPENEQQAIRDLGSPEEAARELIINLAEQNVFLASARHLWHCRLLSCWSYSLPYSYWWLSLSLPAS